MKLKKYNQFVKNINEDIDHRIEEDDMELNPRSEIEIDPINKFDSPEDLDLEVDGELSEDDFDPSDDDFDDYQPDVVDVDDDIPTQEGDYPEEEEEGHEYKGSQLMHDLASRLGTEVNNNQINYNGQTINYYSETEKFHIGRQKFDTAEEVLDFLGGGVENPINKEESIDPIDLDAPIEEIQELGESRKYIKRFK